MLRAVVLVLDVLLVAAGGAFGRDLGAAGLAKLLTDAGLDREQCYRVRDLTLYKEDIKLYLTDGYLTFSKPVAGAPVSALFTAEVEGGDAEVILLPPHRGERLSLANFTQSPNLNEHFKTAILIFADDTASQLQEEIRTRNARKSPEIGALLTEKWDAVLRNLYSSLEIRLVGDLLAANRATGLFYAVVGGSQLGTFDLIYDPQSTEQVSAGQVTYRDKSPVFNVWTSFAARSYRRGLKKQEFRLPFRLDDFHIDATIEPGLGLKVTTRMTLEPLEHINRVLGFELSRRMRVTSAGIDGQPAEVFQRDSLRANLGRGAENDLLLVIAKQPLDPGRKYNVEIQHEGAVISSAGNGVYFVGARGNWYPHRGLEFAQYDLTFRYPKALTLIATGEKVSEQLQDDLRIAHRRTTAPVRIAGFNLGNYEHISLSRSPYQVEVYANRRLEPALQPKPREPAFAPPLFPPRFPPRRPQAPPIPDVIEPPSPTAQLEKLASDVAASLESLSSQYGALPIKDLVVSPIPGAFGQGFPGLIYLSTLSYLTPNQRPAPAREKFQETFFSEVLVAHEIAHQWWGNLVTSAGYQSDWLMESLANYSALMLFEKKKGSRALESILDAYRTHLIEKDPEGHTIESAGPIVWGSRLSSAQSPEAWRLITYEKGSWIIHMLRRRLGDDRFTRLLAEIVKRYRYRPLSTEQFRELAREFVPAGSPDPTLESFFENWVYSTGIPALKLSHSTRGKPPELRVSGSVSQQDVDPDFSADVPVEIQAGRSKTIVKWVRTGPEPASFSLLVRAPSARASLPATSNLLYVRK